MHWKIYSWNLLRKNHKIAASIPGPFRSEISVIMINNNEPNGLLLTTAEFNVRMCIGIARSRAYNFILAFRNFDGPPIRSGRIYTRGDQRLHVSYNVTPLAAASQIYRFRMRKCMRKNGYGSVINRFVLILCAAHNNTSTTGSHRPAALAWVPLCRSSPSSNTSKT